MKHWKRTLLTAAALTASMTASATDIKFIWTSTGLDTSGQVIPEDVLYYAVYVSTDGGEYTMLDSTQDLTYTWEDAPMGCHSAYVIAYRSDADLASEHSGVEEKCITDDTDSQIQMLIPRAPERFNMRFWWRK